MNLNKLLFKSIQLKRIYTLLFLTLPLLFGCSNQWVDKVHQREQLQGQDMANAEEVVVAIRPEYGKSKVHEVFFGGKYRDLWAQPVKMQTIDVFNQGYTFRKVSGGRQSFNLQVYDSAGNQFVLRSIDKMPTKVLSPFLAHSFVGEALKDQVSSGHPYAPLTLPIMSDALGIYHTNPKVVLIKPDPELNQYSNNFPGMVAMLEHRPDEDQSEFDYLGNSKNVIGSQNMLDDLFKDNDSEVDTKNFLKSRLFDMLIGDWSRHESNWRWASYEKDKGELYKAVPRDRDHAYYYMDGFFPNIIRFLFKPHFRSFHEDLPNLKKLNRSGKKLDMLLLSGLDSEDWVAMSNTIKDQLTDEVIDSAMHAMPEEIYELSGATIAKKLKNRRDQLPDKIMDYYLYLMKEPVVYGTDKHERFELEALNNGDVKVKIYKTKKDGELRHLLYDKTFKQQETKKLKLVGLAGNDSFHFTGKHRTTIKITVYGGAGEDAFINEFDDYKGKLIVKDTDAGSDFSVNKGIKVKETEDPDVEYFDANGALINYYIWDH
ncbi:hypothetical protein LVD15_21770 [Fulvivirga maritima]|uniref:hypothetical protein n=1 Tax=Fulvivirga maritima TaxID=2904247 RepID=UPI001F30DF5E|nr:hypothetical protein [Fulvivirga maritima]UII25901.1 hypothetical protein LVD15_21770 [Fulvivirga maritima]